MNLWKLLKNSDIPVTSLLEALANRTAAQLKDALYLARARKKASDFTRKRKMPFEKLMIFILSNQKCSSNTALRRFFKGLGETTTMKQQSYCDARAKVSPEAIEELYRPTVAPMVQRCRKKWNGYRVMAVDGTTVQLPTDKKLGEIFGTLGKNGSAPCARVSILLDILNDIVLDAAIEPLSYDERTLAGWHINRCMDIEPNSKKLFIFDRGYPSFDLIEKLEDEGYYYLMRVKTNWNSGIDAMKAAEGQVCLTQGHKHIKVRVLKFLLSSGETEVLITNIPDKRLGVKAFKELYFLRWPIETKYNTVKNKLALEMFSARTQDGIRQDFWATMYLANLTTAAIYDAQPGIDATRVGHGNKYRYRANINEAIGILKDRLILTLTLDDAHERVALFSDITQEIMAYVSPLRPGRSSPRLPARVANFYHNQRLNS